MLFDEFDKISKANLPDEVNEHTLRQHKIRLLLTQPFLQQVITKVQSSAIEIE